MSIVEPPPIEMNPSNAPDCANAAAALKERSVGSTAIRCRLVVDVRSPQRVERGRDERSLAQMRIDEDRSAPHAEHLRRVAELPQHAAPVFDAGAVDFEPVISGRGGRVMIVAQQLMRSSAARSPVLPAARGRTPGRSRRSAGLHHREPLEECGGHERGSRGAAEERRTQQRERGAGDRERARAVGEWFCAPGRVRAHLIGTEFLRASAAARAVRRRRRGRRD